MWEAVLGQIFGICVLLDFKTLAEPSVVGLSTESLFHTVSIEMPYIFI